MFVLGARHRTEIERGQMPRVSGLYAECLADCEREFGPDQSLFEQFALKTLSDPVDGFRRAREQPRHDQHRAAEQVCVRFEARQRQAAFV